MNKNNYRYLITLEYDGYQYGGYAKQKHRNTIQDNLEIALEKVLHVKIKTTESSRTDAKVHALNQKVMFDLTFKIDLVKIKNMLNDILKDTIYVREIKEIPLTFHVRHDVLNKTYEYSITKTFHPINARYSYHVIGELDINKINEAIGYLEGKKDFKAFCSAKATSITTVRTINYIKVKSVNDFIIFTFNADGYLYNMIRLMMGVLIQIGLGNLKAEQINDILISERQVNNLMSVPAHGLTLTKINYKE